MFNSLDERLLPSPEERPINGWRVVYHGTVTPHYGVELLVEAAAVAMPFVPNLNVRIYGHGDSLAAVIERAETLGIGDAVWASKSPFCNRTSCARFNPPRLVSCRIFLCG